MAQPGDPPNPRVVPPPRHCLFAAGPSPLNLSLRQQGAPHFPLFYASHHHFWQIAPAFDGIELGVGETILIKAISAATGRPPQSIKVDYETEGDLGIVAQASRTTQKTLFKPKVLSLKAVFDALKEIAHISGGSVRTFFIQNYSFDDAFLTFFI